MTTLSGEIGTSGASDNSYHVVTAIPGTNNNAILDGFTITSGNANGAGDDNYGGGMIVDSSVGEPSNPGIFGCVFLDNDAGLGGGIYNRGSGQISNCTF